MTHYLLLYIIISLKNQEKRNTERIMKKKKEKRIMELKSLCGLAILS